MLPHSNKCTVAFAASPWRCQLLAKASRLVERRAECSRDSVGTMLGVKRNPEGIGHSFKLLRRQIVVRPGLPNVPEFSTEQIIDQ
jgi:hypothetical protein